MRRATSSKMDRVDGLLVPSLFEELADAAIVELIRMVAVLGLPLVVLQHLVRDDALVTHDGKEPHLVT